MKKTALLIMAAGIGSRYGKGIKQLAKVGPSGEIIMDYSIHDALRAGFDKVVFIIRRDIEEEFREVIGNRIEKHADVAYVFQDMNDLPEGFSVPEGRVKPWGTGQAVLAAREVIDCPFIVINADDFYGPGGFKAVHDYLVNDMDDRSGKLDLCMAGYVLGNTLSENGTVARGVCRADEDFMLTEVNETFDIANRGGVVSGKDGNGAEVLLKADDIVSMNMWGFPQRMMKIIEERFPAFLKGIKEGDLKAEYLLPNIVDQLIREGRASVKVLPTNDRWYGMTYAEDRAYVEKAIADMTAKGIYEERLFG